MLVLVFYVPKDYCEAVKEAVFAAGAGVLGAYQNCAFETEGKGQFRPLEGANPFLGEVDKLEFVTEIRVEMVCEEGKIEQVKAALKASHPYETPAFHFLKAVDP